MSETFATISSRMRLNFFSRHPEPAPELSNTPVMPTGAPTAPAPEPLTGRTFPADEVAWGIAIRNGYDEIDDPSYHKGTTQHAYLEGNDNVAICGFRPQQSGPRTRRRSRLGMPTAGEHPMCGMCARMVVAPRPRVPMPVQPGRAPVAVPVAPAAPVPVPVSVAPAAVPMPAGIAPAGAPGAGGPAPVAGGQPTAPTSPWVKQRSGIEEPTTITVDLAGKHDSGLLDRGVRTEVSDD